MLSSFCKYTVQAAINAKNQPQNLTLSTVQLHFYSLLCDALTISINELSFLYNEERTLKKLTIHGYRSNNKLEKDSNFAGFIDTSHMCAIDCNSFQPRLYVNRVCSFLLDFLNCRQHTYAMLFSVLFFYCTQ